MPKKSNNHGNGDFPRHPHDDNLAWGPASQRPPHHAGVHRSLHGHPPHHHGHPLHHQGHPPHHPGHRDERLVNNATYMGAASTLEKLLPAQFVGRMTRAMVSGPPEMLALFRLHNATIEHQIAQLEAEGISVPQFDPADLSEGEDSLDALSIALPGSHRHGCLDDLMAGPVEVQAVSIVSLISLRLAAIASARPTTEEVGVDG